jgi:tetratricopeptide (TPR) repeat protein
LSEHPSREQLQRLVRCELGKPESEQILEHLEIGCEICGRLLEDGFAELLGSLNEAERPPRLAGAAYESAITRALAFVRRRARSLARERARAAQALPVLREARSSSEVAVAVQGLTGTWAYCEMLLECSRELRHRDPQRMIWFAELAKRAAENLDPVKYRPPMVADRQALAWAELGNSYRIADRLGEAETALATAGERRKAGTGDPLLEARVLDLTASLRVAQRRFTEAQRLLDRTYAMYRTVGDRHLAGRALISKGIYKTYQQDTAAALDLLREGLRLIDRRREPKLTLAALHDLLWLMVDRGEYRRARRELFENLDLYQRDGDPLNLLKKRWLEGRIAAGLGDLDRAEAALRQVREGLSRLRLSYKAAIAGLELGAVWLRQGRTAEVRGLVGETIAVFKMLGIAREALGALILLRSACEQEYVTLEFLADVLKLLRKLEKDPACRFDGALDSPDSPDPRPLPS